jgi:hypothetical protein
MKFIWYNYYDVGAYVSKKRNTSGVGEGLLGSVEYKSLAKINELFSNYPWGMLHDISGHVAHPFNVLTRTPYQYRNYTQSFDQTCLAAAEQIAKRRFCIGGSDANTIMGGNAEVARRLRAELKALEAAP